MARPGKKLDRTILNSSLQRDSLFDDQESASIVSAVLPFGFDSKRAEASYSALVDSEHRRRYGQYFTPQPIAELMCEWIAGCKPVKVLDPATGPGIFVRESCKRIPDCEVTAIDIDNTALEAGRKAVGDLDRVSFLQGDFLTWHSGATFDAIVANPPYLKHHNFHYEHDIFADIGGKNGVQLTRLTNIYVLFILEICRRLRSSGRAAIIVPGEWVNANYGDALKEYLLKNHLLNVLLYFSHSSLVFDEALTTASVLFIEKKERATKAAEILSAYVESAVGIEELKPLLSDNVVNSSKVLTQRLPTKILLSAKKWDYTLSHIEAAPPDGFVPLSELAETRRGIATGANEFFHVPLRFAQEREIQQRHLLACVGRAVDVPSFIFTKADFEALVNKDARTQLISFEGGLDDAEFAYVKEGELQGLNERYLLAGRTPWYSMEKRQPGPIWAAVFGRKGLRFIHNAMRVYNLTTFHCIYPKNNDPIHVQALVAVLNSHRVQELSKKQRRVYGGGLAKFEPRDLLDVLVPDLRRVSDSSLGELAALLRELDGLARQSDDGIDTTLRNLDNLVDKIALEATSLSLESRLILERPDQSSPLPLWARHTHHGARAE